MVGIRLDATRFRDRAQAHRLGFFVLIEVDSFVFVFIVVDEAAHTLAGRKKFRGCREKSRIGIGFAVRSMDIADDAAGMRFDADRGIRRLPINKPRSFCGSRTGVVIDPFADSFFGGTVELRRRERGEVARLRLGKLFGDDFPERIKGDPGQFFNLERHGEKGIGG